MSLSSVPGPTGATGAPGPTSPAHAIKSPEPPTEVQRAIRTGISAAVGFIVAFLATKGFHIPAADSSTAITALTAAAGTGYNALALYAEKRWSWAKWLLLNIGN